MVGCLPPSMATFIRTIRVICLNDEREEAVGILLGRAGSIGRIPTLGDMIVNTVRNDYRKQICKRKTNH